MNIKKIIQYFETLDICVCRWIITFILIKIACIDWRFKKIYNSNLLSLFIASGFLWGISGKWIEVDKIIGILIISMPMLILTLVRPGCFGGGDIKLVAVCGFLLGMQEMLQAFWIALLISAVYAIYLLSMGKSYKTEISFGPFICMGVLCIFLGIF